MILESRKVVYKLARKKHPERWSGKTRNWDRKQTVNLNPGDEPVADTELNKAA